MLILLIGDIMTIDLFVITIIIALSATVLTVKFYDLFINLLKNINIRKIDDDEFMRNRIAAQKRYVDMKLSLKTPTNKKRDKYKDMENFNAVRRRRYS